MYKIHFTYKYSVLHVCCEYRLGLYVVAINACSNLLPGNAKENSMSGLCFIIQLLVQCSCIHVVGDIHFVLDAIGRFGTQYCTLRACCAVLKYNSSVYFDMFNFYYFVSLTHRVISFGKQYIATPLIFDCGCVREKRCSSTQFILLRPMLQYQNLLTSIFYKRTLIV